MIKKALYRDLYIIMDKLNMIFEVLKEEIQYYCIFESEIHCKMLLQFKIL